MIDFQNNFKQSLPTYKFFSLYQEAIKKQQPIPQAVSISSYCQEKRLIDSRFVNLKYVRENEFIFFSNYKSNKAKQFESNPDLKVTMLVYWSSIDVQIRIQGVLSKLHQHESDIHYKKRSKEKNALSTSSNQSSKIEKYEDIVNKYNKTLESNNFDTRPDYWGGYSLKASYFEFWKGHENRINKREVYELEKENWNQYILEP